ncbi:MAG: hypothetical protein ACN6OI_03580 [Flavobacterium sp.]|uniref:hypothetical protein n=1 Tax=Flavobacterium sp. TaxID=239 RepID=UPI003D0AB762
MKSLFKIRILILVLTAGLVFSCKKHDTNAVDPEYKSETDSMDMSVDTVGPAMDSSATLNPEQNGQQGTTGATGEGTTGSGTEGSTQKGNQNVRTDSLKK